MHAFSQYRDHDMLSCCFGRAYSRSPKDSLSHAHTHTDRRLDALFIYNSDFYNYFVVQDPFDSGAAYAFSAAADFFCYH